MLPAGQVNEHKVGNGEWVRYTKKKQAVSNQLPGNSIKLQHGDGTEEAA